MLHSTKTSINFMLFCLSILYFGSCSQQVGLPGLKASGPDEKSVKTLKETKTCVKCNLQQSNLNYAKLGKADLSEAVLDSSSLNGVGLTGASLNKANFVKTDLSVLESHDGTWRSFTAGGVLK